MIGLTGNWLNMKIQRMPMARAAISYVGMRLCHGSQ